MKHIPLLVLSILLVPLLTNSQVKLKHLQIDESITGFKYAYTSKSKFKIYVPDGADLRTSKTVSTFSVGIVHHTSVSETQAYLDRMIRSEYPNYSTISKLNTHDTVLSGRKIYERTVIETLKDKSVSLNYYAFLMQGSSAVIFIGFDFEAGYYLPKYKTTFYNLLIKKVTKQVRYYRPILNLKQKHYVQHNRFCR